MPSRNPLHNSSHLDAMNHAVPTTIKLPIAAAQILNGMSIDFNLMLSDAIDAGCMSATIKVPYQFRSVGINVELRFSTYKKIHDFLNHMERSSNEIGRMAGLILAKYLNAHVGPISGRLASSQDTKLSVTLDREAR